MGKLLSGTTKTTSTEKSDTGPSAFQKPYLDETFGAAKSVYNEQKETPYYQGPTYAGMTDEQKATQARLGSYAGGQGFDTGNRISSIGGNMVDGAAGKAVTNLDRFTTLAGGDAAGDNMSQAARYAANPHIDGMIDAASRDVNRNLYERELPGIDRAASGNGNINSSRAGVASGIAQRGAADRISDISSNIRGAAYDNGLDRAQRDRASQMDAYGRASSAYGDLTNQGVDQLTHGTDMSYDALGRQAGSQAVGQTDRQGEMDAAFKKWAGTDSRKMDLLSRYQSIVGSNQWGQSGTSSGTGTSKESGNILGKLAGAAAAAGSMATGFSDRRLKDNIVCLNVLPDGLKVYAYTYRQELAFDQGLDLPLGFQIGVMADEVALLRPHALGPVSDGGYASVNYAAL